jgi:hydrogenase maturation protease
VSAAAGSFVEPHAMNPINVLRMAMAMHGELGRVLLVGCEPSSFGGEDGKMGLSTPVEASVAGAVRVIENLVRKTLDEGHVNTTN